MWFVLAFVACAAFINVEATSSGWVFREKAHFGGRTNIVKGSRASAHQKHRVEIFMKLRNMDKLHDVLMKVSDPSHADYGKHWSREEVFAMTGNAGGSREVSKYLEAHGARVVGRAAYEESLTVEAPIGVWEKLLVTEFHEFQHEDWTASGEKMVRSLEYSLPSELHEHVEHVFHVSDFPPIVQGGPVMSAETHDIPLANINTAGTIYSGYVTPAYLSQLYNIQSNTGSALTKQAFFASLGQYVSPADLTRFQNTMGITADSLDGNIGVAGHMSDAPCASNSNNCAESNLDAQYLMGVSQNVPTYHIYYDSCNYLSMLSNITASVNPPKVISISYGGYGYSSSYATAFNSYALTAGVMGITILVSSGDDGAVNFGVRGNSALCHYEPSFPAYSQYVTAVGATQGPEKGGAEVACSSATSGVITTGGGFSYFPAVDPLPSWQSSQVNQYFSTVTGTSQAPVSGYSTGARGYPDISLIGSSYLTYINGAMYVLYGTSASSPAFGGMISLINAALKAQGKATVGFVNPLLYSASSSYVRDITSGSNFCTVGGTCCSQGFYTAAGWDPVTGLGVPNFNNLLNAALAAASATAPPSASPTIAPNRVPTGGPTFVSTRTPSTAPTTVPTARPTVVPTRVPTTGPSAVPSAVPSVVPTRIPTVAPTTGPSAVPSIIPTRIPTTTPSTVPTLRTTVVPTRTPTASPSAVPSRAPSVVPTRIPSVTPTAIPTRTPTAVPSRIPTASPTAVPSRVPSVVPTKIPTNTPTVRPSAVPTIVPTAVPTKEPTFVPTKVPTVVPTRIPTREPTAVPTKVPTAVPTKTPTRQPTVVPTKIPTATPTVRPTAVPSCMPTKIPTATPTAIPTTAAPTFAVNQVGQVACPPYAVTNTNNAVQNVATCQILACNGNVVSLKMCSAETVGQGKCTGNTFLRVRDASGVEVANNDNYCGLCAGLTFTASAQCQMYTIMEGCAGSASCSGTVAVSYYSPV